MDSGQLPVNLNDQSRCEDLPGGAPRLAGNCMYVLSSSTQRKHRSVSGRGMILRMTQDEQGCEDVEDVAGISGSVPGLRKKPTKIFQLRQSLSSGM